MFKTSYTHVDVKWNKFYNMLVPKSKPSFKKIVFTRSTKVPCSRFLLLSLLFLEVSDRFSLHIYVLLYSYTLETYQSSQMKCCVKIFRN